MKSKRSGYLVKVSQSKEKTTKTNPMPAQVDLVEEKKTEQECGNGICSIAWKPAAAAR